MSDAPNDPDVFSVAWLADLVNKKTLRRGKKLGPANIQRLARRLNHIRAMYLQNRRMHEQRDSALADQVADALFILARFHSERQKEYAKLDPKNPWSAEVIERERELKEAFDRYFVGMTRHRPDLDMDAAAMAPRLESWRYIADQIAGEFRAAFARANDGRLLGNSNDGPVAKFVSATIPLITREKPEPGNVAKHLKDRARGRRSSPRRPREPGQRRSRAVPVPNMRARVPDRPA